MKPKTYLISFSGLNFLLRALHERWIADISTLELSERQPDGSYRVAYMLVPIADVEEGFKARDRAVVGAASELREIERLRVAIRSTASQGTYDEMTIRKAVGFELAELIVAAHHH